MSMERTESHDLTGLPQGFLEALGRVAAHYGQIEHLLMVMIKRTTEMDWDKVFEPMRNPGKKPERLDDWRTKVGQFFDQWADKKFPGQAAERKQQFQALLKRIGALAKMRHIVIHAAWGVTETEGVRATRHGWPLVRDDNQLPVGQVDVAALADDLRRALWQLNQAVDPPPPLKGPASAGVHVIVSGVSNLVVTATCASFDANGPHSPYPVHSFYKLTR